MTLCNHTITMTLTDPATSLPRLFGLHCTRPTHISGSPHESLAMVGVKRGWVRWTTEGRIVDTDHPTRWAIGTLCQPSATRFPMTPIAPA